VPGLKQLLGQAPQHLGIGGGINGPTHALQFELLAKAEGEGLGHRLDSLLPQRYKLFRVPAYRMQQG
jgi:hypothetical protein